MESGDPNVVCYRKQAHMKKGYKKKGFTAKFRKHMRDSGIMEYEGHSMAMTPKEAEREQKRLAKKEEKKANKPKKFSAAFRKIMRDSGIYNYDGSPMAMTEKEAERKHKRERAKKKAKGKPKGIKAAMAGKRSIDSHRISSIGSKKYKLPSGDRKKLEDVQPEDFY